MRKILLLSDTHSHLDEKVLKYVDSVDEVWHAGDIGTVEVCKQIEKLKADRQDASFPVWDLRIFHDREICVDVARTSITVATLRKRHASAGARVSVPASS